MTIDKDKVITYQTKPQSNSDCSFTCKGIKNELCETAIGLSCDDLMTPGIVKLRCRTKQLSYDSTNLQLGRNPGLLLQID